jgi:hypothetical protein
MAGTPESWIICKYKQLDKARPFQYSYRVFHAEIAQMVEHRTENPGVPGSIPGLGTILS